MVNSIVKYRNIILLTIGSILVLLSVCMLLYDKFILLKSNVVDEIELVKYREKNADKPKSSEDVVVEDVDTNEIEEDTKTKPTTSNNKTITKEYIGYLQIEKVNLKQGLVSKNSYYNNVNYGIQTINMSDYPDKVGGNLILASHSGTSSISYFKHLYKLSIGDVAKVYYKNKVYSYKIINIYNVPKVGKVEIRRNYDQTCLTLITCTHNSKKEQTVYILELFNTETDGGTSG